MSLRGIALIIFIGGSLPVCLVRPFYGVVLWTILAFLNPQRFTWGVADMIPWSNLVAITTITGFLIFQRGWLRRFASPHVALIVALWVWFLITSLISTETPSMVHHAEDTWFRFQFVSKVLLMTLVTFAMVDSFARLRILVLAIAGSFAFFVFKSLPFILLTGGVHRIFGPEHSMIADNNDFGLALNMTIPLFFLLAQTEPGQLWRWLWWVAFVASIPTIFFTYSRGALVGLAAVMLLMILGLKLKQKMIILPVIAVGLVIAVLFAPGAWKERMDPTRPDAIDASAKSRFNAWTFSWRLAQDYPLAGGGFETFSPELFREYAPNVMDVHGPHSIYFGVLAEHGLIGLALYLSLVGYCFLTTMRVARRARLYGNYALAAYAMMFRFSMVGFLVSGLFLGRAYFDYYFTIVAGIAIVHQIGREEIIEEPEPDFAAAEIA